MNKASTKNEVNESNSTSILSDEEITSRSFLERLKVNIDKLNSIQHEEIYRIINEEGIRSTSGNNVVFVLSTELRADVIRKILNYISFCEKNKL